VPKRVAIIQGHPDATGSHFCNALADSYAAGARGEGHEVRIIDVARIVVTMGMPALVYRWYFGAYGLKSLERGILAFAGIGPIRESLVGMVESRGNRYRGRWLIKMQSLGRQAR
jgi:putative NADPH-quinone reductase